MLHGREIYLLTDYSGNMIEYMLSLINKQIGKVYFALMQHGHLYFYIWYLLAEHNQGKTMKSNMIRQTIK